MSWPRAASHVGNLLRYPECRLVADRGISAGLLLWRVADLEQESRPLRGARLGRPGERWRARSWLTRVLAWIIDWWLSWVCSRASRLGKRPGSAIACRRL